MKSIQEYIAEQEYLLEVNRIIQGLSKRSGKPADHIGGIWKDTEKELVSKHKYGVTDKYKEIGKLVRSKLGVEPNEKEKAEEENDTKK